MNISMNHETMRRRGFVPYGPSRAGAESLSIIMAEDLRPYGIAVSMLLPGGATDTGMIPDGMSDDVRRSLLPAQVMGPPRCSWPHPRQKASPANGSSPRTRRLARPWHAVSTGCHLDRSR